MIHRSIIIIIIITTTHNIYNKAAATRINPLRHLKHSRAILTNKILNFLIYQIKKMPYIRNSDYRKELAK